MVPWLVILLVNWRLSLDLEDLVVQVLEFVGPSHSLFKSDRWYNTRGIPFNDRVESFEEPHNLLLHSVNQLGGISRQPLKLREVLLHGRVTLYELLEFDCLLPLHMRRYIFVTELSLETCPSVCICYGPILSLDRLPPYVR